MKGGVERPVAERLSERESEVLRGVLEGQSNKEIGALLGITESSVKALAACPVCD